MVCVPFEVADSFPRLSIKGANRFVSATGYVRVQGGAEAAVENSPLRNERLGVRCDTRVAVAARSPAATRAVRRSAVAGRDAENTLAAWGT